MIDPERIIIRDRLVELADTHESYSDGTTSGWWRGEILDIIAEFDSFTEFLKHGAEEMMPMMERSVFSMSLVPDGKPDPKFCMELGAAIMYDKPIIAMVMPGAKVPDTLRRVAHDVVELDLNNPESKAETARVIQNLLISLKEDGVLDDDDEVVSDD